MDFCILRTRTGTDFRAVAALESIGVCCVAVVNKKMHRHRRSKKRITRYAPALSGYVFAKVSNDEWQAVKRTKDVLGPVMNMAGTAPALVPEYVVDRFQRLFEIKQDDAPTQFSQGDAVTWQVLGKAFEGVVTDVDTKGLEEMVTAFTNVEGKKMTVRREAGQFRVAA